jgi:hypothetical protein
MTDEEERTDSEFSYVIGHVAQRDIVDDEGKVVVAAGAEVTAADAVAAVAAGVLEDLAFAVGAGDHSRMEPHGVKDAPAEQ